MTGFGMCDELLDRARWMGQGFLLLRYLGLVRKFVECFGIIRLATNVRALTTTAGIVLESSAI